MLVNIFKKIGELVKNHSDIFTHEHEKAFLDLKAESPKHIDFYAVNAEVQIINMVSVINNCIDWMNGLSDQLKSNLNLNRSALNELALKINKIVLLLKRKQEKLNEVQEKIPKGMLDVKRALIIAKNAPISEESKEDAVLRKHLVNIQVFMKELNILYTNVLLEGGNPYLFLEQITTLYWKKINEHTKQLHLTLTDLERSISLTKEGKLILLCFKKAIITAPQDKKVKRVERLLSRLATQDQPQKIDTLRTIGFCSTNGIEACIYLSSRGKQFFHAPLSDGIYHFDYDPCADLANTGGDCFGQSILFIHSLTKGQFNCFCPAPPLINFQIDQTRTLVFEKETIGYGQTIVSEKNPDDSLQWEDIKSVLTENPSFKPNSICTLVLSMNDYTKSKTDFTPSHIAVLAKLDRTLSPYKYIFFEKDFGAFGVEDDECLEYIIADIFLPLYAGMCYSQLKLVKYGETSAATYDLIQRIPPLADKPVSSLVKGTIGNTTSSLFFQPQQTLQNSTTEAGASSMPS